MDRIATKAARHKVISRENGNCNVYFRVLTPKGKEYGVIYRKDSELWSCDCVYNTFFGAGDWCSHILCCYMVENGQKGENTDSLPKQ